MDQKLFMIYYGNVPAYQAISFFKNKAHVTEGNAKIRIGQYKSKIESNLYDLSQGDCWPAASLKVNDGTLVDLEKLHIVEFVSNQSNIIEQLLNYISMSYRGDLDEYHFAEIEAIANGLGFAFDDNCCVQREEEQQ